jgi:orotidine-5'-phosphate decarboxylase
MAELVVALDLPSGAEALSLAERLPGLRWVKIGPVLYVREGPALVREFRARGFEVFLDLKWHDIPNTVAGAVSAAGELGVGMATVHTLGGAAMMAAAAGAAADDLALVGVTVLTAHDAPALGALLGRTEEPDVGAEVDRLAAAALAAGLNGVVASPLEVARLRAGLGPDPRIVVPGIRPQGYAADDQRRVATARDAVQAGATHLVIGRPVTQAENPAATFEGLCNELDR